MLRLSVSALETFRYFKANEDGTVEDLVARLTYATPPTPQMEAGRAFAKFLEHAKPGDLDSVTVDGWTFNFDGDLAFPLPQVRELKAEVLFTTPSGPVTLVGKCDGLNGITIRDAKLTEKFDPERYLDSLQWRSYLHMFRAREFVYDVFVGKYEGRTVTISEFHPLSLYAYSAMGDDVQRAVDELAAIWVEHVVPRLVAGAA